MFDFKNVNRKFMLNYATLFGLWAPDDSSTGRGKLYYIYALLVFLIVHLFNLILQLFLMTKTTNLKVFCELFSLFNNFFLSAVKCFMMHKQRQKLNKLERILHFEDFHAQDEQERRIKSRYRNFLRFDYKF